MTKTFRRRLEAMTPDELDAAVQKTDNHLEELKRRGEYIEPSYAETLAASEEFLEAYESATEEADRYVKNWTTWGSSSTVARKYFQYALSAIYSLSLNIVESWSEEGAPAIAPGRSGPRGIVPPEVPLPDKMGILIFQRTTAGWNCELRPTRRTVSVRLIVLDHERQSVLVDAVVKRGLTTEIRRSKIKDATHFVILKSES